MAQTSYSQAVAAYAGLIADLSPHTILSLKNEESSDVPFGLAVAEGTSVDQFALPTAADDEIAGITVHSHALDNRGISTQQSIPTQRIASIMRDGYVYAVPELAVTKGDPVFYRIANGVADATETQKGSLTNIDDSGTAVRLPNARWAATGAKDVATMVEIRALPQGTKASDAILSVAHAQATSDTTQFLMETPADKFFILDEAVYYNATGLAADAANYFDIQLKHGTTVLANWSTETGEEGSIASDTPVRLTNGSDLVVPPDTRLNLFLDETGTATLPIGTIQIVGRFV
jgi:hypothetical protein